jgi:hypothetical protein
MDTAVCAQNPHALGEDSGCAYQPAARRTAA